MRFLLIHDSQPRSSETLRSFFTDMYDAFVKVHIFAHTLDNNCELYGVDYFSTGSAEPFLCPQYPNHCRQLQKKSTADCKEISIVVCKVCVQLYPALCFIHSSNFLKMLICRRITVYQNHGMWLCSVALVMDYVNYSLCTGAVLWTSSSALCHSSWQFVGSFQKSLYTSREMYW